MNWETTWIVGGGLSASEFDASRVTSGVVLGVNDAAFHKPCQAFFSNDHNSALKTRKQIEAFAGERHLSVFPRRAHLFRDWRGVTLWQRVMEDTPSLKRGALASGGRTVPGCSGYVALNLAAQKGAKRIVLCGYDFSPTYNYFFDPKPIARREVAGVLASFRAVAPWYRARGIQILNANPASAIDAFDRVTLGEAYLLAA